MFFYICNSQNIFLLLYYIYFCVRSLGIKSVVDNQVEKLDSGLSNGMCSYCEMAVVWMQSQLTQNKTLEQVLNYLNEVRLHPETLLFSLGCCLYIFPLFIAVMRANTKSHGGISHRL